MRLLIDLMGGEISPERVLAIAIDSFSCFTQIDKIIVIGQSKYKPSTLPDWVDFIEAEDFISHEDDPLLAIRKKKNLL